MAEIHSREKSKSAFPLFSNISGSFDRMKIFGPQIFRSDRDLFKSAIKIYGRGVEEGVPESCLLFNMHILICMVPISICMDSILLCMATILICMGAILICMSAILLCMGAILTCMVTILICMSAILLCMGAILI